MTILLGQEMHMAAFAVRPAIGPDEAARLVRLLVRVIGMKTWYRAGGRKLELPPQVWTYPLPDGGGGTGETILQPAFSLVQPLLESYAGALVGADTWAEHGGWFLIINSCRKFRAIKVRSHLRIMGYEVVGAVHGKLSLRPPWWKRFWRGEK